MRERAILFGAHLGLVGIVCEPAQAPAVRRGVLLANVGTNHRVGPYRLWVELARTLAAAGWYVLRFDQAGLGDSAPRPGASTAGDDGTVDLSEAMAWLADNLAVEQFVLIGLCSGVDAAHRLATDDARVVGAAFIDGYSYPTRGWRLRRHTVRYLQGARWFGFARRRLRRVLTGGRTRGELATVGQQLFDRRDPPEAEFRREVSAMTSRGARLLFVFTGTVDQRYNARDQLFETLGAAAPAAAVEVDLCREADHVFSGVETRRALVARLADWTERLGG